MRRLCTTLLSIFNRLRPAVERRGGSDARIQPNEDADGEEKNRDEDAEEEEANGQEEEEADGKAEVLVGHPVRMLDHPLTPRLLTAAALALGWGYGEGFPWPWGAAPRSLVRPLGWGGKTNCSTFAAHLLFGAYPDAEWTEQAYKQLMVWRAEEPWSALEPPVEFGLGKRVPNPVDGEWHLAQSWSTNKSGHTYLFFADGNDLYILESNVGVGPQWRLTSWHELIDARQVRLVKLNATQDDQRS